MDKAKLSDMLKGWFVGNFEPTVFKTTDVEVAVRSYKKGEQDKKHHHKIATEITVVVKGTVRLRDQIFEEGDIITVNPGESVDFQALTDASVCVVKLPGANNDKYED